MINKSAGAVRLASRIPLPVWVVTLLAVGIGLGLCLPTNSAVRAIYTSGTYFPRLLVTLASLLIFHLLTAATAKLLLNHKQRAGRLFVWTITLYVSLGIASLIYATAWLAILSGLPFTGHGTGLPVSGRWTRQIVLTFTNVLTQQPLLQALVGGVLVGWLIGITSALRPAAHGFIAVSDGILKLFRKLIWYYPIMIGSLAIGIPLKFGHRGLALYGKSVLWDMVVIVLWCIAMALLCKAITQRSWKQIASYYGTVWPTGFGTGGSYDTLAVNLISAEKDLGLSPEIAEVSIIFGTVLNKSCATMSVLIATVIVATLLGIPLSISQIALLIPPVVILGLESPGIPGGVAYFMSPVLAELLHVPDRSLWVATFVAFYSGLIPMFSTAGNTTNDGVIGAILEDRFQQTDSQVGKHAEVVTNGGQS